MSDTPRTDAHNWNEGHYDDPLHSFLDFAKQLERELNAANESFKKLNIHALNLAARIQRLEDTGDYLCAAAAFMGWHDKIEEWNKAKESKQ